MKIKSFVEDHFKVNTIEIEIELVPGLPGIKILGQPEQLIRDSQFRIVSALHHLGFELPESHQVIVNLKPMRGIKKSQGLDLPIALGLLHLSHQLPIPESFLNKELWIYGSLSLNGEVSSYGLDDKVFYKRRNGVFLTGPGNPNLFADQYVLKTLVDVTEPCRQEKSSVKDENWRRPEPTPFFWNTEQAQLLSLIGLGEHSCFLGGLPGSGKTSLARSLWSLLYDFKEEKRIEVQQLNRYYGRARGWRPFVEPHHSASVRAMIGGGSLVQPGAISQAHGGILFLDEFLEFHQLVIESLREPMETGRIQLYRGENYKSFPAEFILIATSNLCPCGYWMPARKSSQQRSCRCSSRKLRSYQERLSGPMMERFSLFYLLSDELDEGQVTSQEILNKIIKGRSFAERTRGQYEVNERIESSVLEKQLKGDFSDLKKECGTNYRRWVRWLKVSRSIADLEENPAIERHHFIEAYNWSFHSQDLLKARIH